MRTPELFRSLAFRLALAFALTITAAMAAVFALVYLEISTSDVARLRVVLTDEAAKGVNESDAELRRALDLRLTRDLRRLDYVALYNPDGTLAFGNVPEMPGIAVDGAAHFVAAAHPSGAEDREEPALFVARRRPDGGVLLLGRSLLEVYAIRSTVLRALVTGLAPMIVLALAIGAYFARRASQRLTRIHDTIARIMAGDLGARLPVSDKPGDIDKVARAVNLMLDEIGRLLDQLKSVGDNIAHDLRAPLAVVRAKLERALAEDTGAQALRSAATEALVRLDKATIAISALLRVSAVESGLRLSAFREIDIAEICMDLFEFYEPLARANDIAMTIDAPATATMSGDADLMREAISNLIDNAIKFTPVGGKVRLEVIKQEGPPLVRVTDSGRGVAPAERERIFGRFYRGAGGDDAEGHGLGLSIARMIANLHGFDLSVTDNAPGARFELAPQSKAARAIDQARKLIQQARLP
jgi:signal transduction histidine kinase